MRLLDALCKISPFDCKYSKRDYLALAYIRDKHGNLRKQNFKHETNRRYRF